jgi:hypothetical protein
MSAASSRRLVRPRPARVRAGDPDVEAIREEWVVEDRWWTCSPVRRHYFELVLADGRNLVVFQDLVSGGWFEQRC